MRPRNQAGTEFPHSKGNDPKAGSAPAKAPQRSRETPAPECRKPLGA